MRAQPLTLQNSLRKYIFDPLTILFLYFVGGRVYKWKFCLSVCLSVRLSVITSYSFPFLSDCKLRRITQPLPRYPMSPIHVSYVRQSTGPPMNRIISQTFLVPSGVELCVNLTFFRRCLLLQENWHRHCLISWRKFKARVKSPTMIFSNGEGRLNPK